jgi:hypothetical protein
MQNPTRPELIDDRADRPVRDLLGDALGRATTADFAVARIRLAALDLTGGEVAGVARCRVLLGRLDADSLGTAAGEGGERLRNAAVLRDFVASGRLEVRAAGLTSWVPDFSALRLHDGRRLAFLGAHHFARTQPHEGPAFTAVFHDPDAVDRLALRFEEIWSLGYDVLPVVTQTLDHFLRTRAGPGLDG